MMAGKQNICVAVYAGELTANITLNVLLIPYFGIEGAAIATASAMGVEAVLLPSRRAPALGLWPLRYPARWPAPASASGLRPA